MLQIYLEIGQDKLSPSKSETKWSELSDISKGEAALHLTEMIRASRQRRGRGPEKDFILCT